MEESAVAGATASLPAYVFPMKPPGVNPRSDPLNSSNTDAGLLRASPRNRPHDIAIHAQPPFQFSPASTVSTTTSPPRSPNKAAPPPFRTSGHRRGGSEFIGGDGATSGGVLLSTSPTKSVDPLPLPPGSMKIGGPGRRGHAHRRSGAISSHDLSNIFRPSSEPFARSGSAPNTPSDPTMNQAGNTFAFNNPSSQPTLRLPERSQPQSTVLRHTSLPSLSQSRPRVGFSDTLEFIPRPLSTISSETSSSFSTVRPNHSVTGSMSSVTSASCSSTSPSSTPARRSYEIAHEDECRTRPSTANATMGSPSNRDTLATALETARRPTSASGSPRVLSAKSRSKASSSTDQPRMDLAVFKGRPPSTSDTTGDLARGNSKKKKSRQQELESLRAGEKVMHWAGSILSKKAKSSDTLPRRPPTPPNLRAPISAEECCMDRANLADEDFQIAPESPADHSKVIRTDFSGWKSSMGSPRLPLNRSSPVLDLDLAMGPTSTTSFGSDSDQSFGSGFATAKRRMHSSGATGTFGGPGMHYHRRAESAPEMLPIADATLDAFPAGTLTAMADVFEEEEEEDLRLVREQNRVRTDFKHGLGVDTTQLDLLERRGKATLECVGDEKDTSTVGPEHASHNSTQNTHIIPVDAVESSEEPRFSVITKTSDEPTSTPTVGTGTQPTRPSSSPLDYAFPVSSAPTGPSEAASSVVSSPDFGNTSFDVPRLNTAHSSFTDRTNWSIPKSSDHSEQGMSYASDDVPSLTSSASTMLSASQHARFPPSTTSHNRLSGDRSTSFQSGARIYSRPTSSSKRSSLASLSKLVGGSYGEKSKLSIESRAQDDPVKTDKKRGNRLSRIMKNVNFFRSKERLDGAS